LKLRFDALKKKLLDEGLFDDDRKQELPALPARIGVITSPGGAAVRDILSILGRRFPAIPVVIYPAAVQGDAAPGELLGALASAVRRAECDVLILSRGGGSLEDLWAFNDEELARAIAECPVPIISAVGHEVDFTIADFVADVRAPTPSGAAEIVVPDQVEWQRRLDALAARVYRISQREVEDRAQQLDWLRKRLIAGSPTATLRRQHDRLQEKRRRLAIFARHALANTSHRIALLARALNSVSPLATLDRGYAIVMKAESGNALLRADEVNAGDDIRARLSQGELIATVKDVIDED
jgi:exodeoxyribonuclease VII large subunit